VASAVYRAIDENWFGTTAPEYLELLGPKFLKGVGAETAYGHGFKLLPKNFNAPLSTGQRRALEAVGYAFEEPAAASPDISQLRAVVRV
jgi:hypothetical protein